MLSFLRLKSLENHIFFDVSLYTEHNSLEGGIIMLTVPYWLTALSWVSIILASICFIYIVCDIIKHPQQMKIMTLVWPLTALFGSIIWVIAYKKWGENNSSHEMVMDGSMTMENSMNPKPMAVSVFIGTCHCGAGCSLADLMIEWLLYFFPTLYIFGGYPIIFSQKLFSGFVLAFILALFIGIMFQYFAIVPMKHLSRKEGIVAAIKADTLSLSCWQIGMYITVSLCQLVVFPHYFGGAIPPTSPVFWFMMQIAMLVGFCTAYPMNWFLIKTGVKERM